MPERPDPSELEPAQWSLLFSRLQPCQRALRGPASPEDLDEVEHRIGRRLPRAYRSFLLCADGGTLGDDRIYGSIELLGLLDSCQVPSELTRVPFHPLRFGVECLELETGSVEWARFASHELLEADVHEVARKVVRGGAFPERQGLSFERTYDDFTDWGLDVLFGLHYPMAAYV